MNSPLFDMSPYQSGATQNYSTDWIDATDSDPAWDESLPDPNLETSTEESSGVISTGWQSADVFTITLQSGQAIEVKFIPCLEGKLRMHQFDFIGPVSTTGFKSHFVLAVEAEGYPHPSDYAQAYIQDLVARFEAAQQQAKSKKRARPVAEAQAPQRQANENDSSTQETTMAEEKSPESSRAKIEVVEELSPEEEADRQRLELRVERAFYESGLALKELRYRRLYRNTHKSFEQYCQDRFGFQRRYPYYLIDAVDVVDNLCTNSAQILPNKETQVRPLTKLKPDKQYQVWQEAVEQVDGRVPPARIVKDAVLRHVGIVERIKQKNPSPSEFAQGDVVEIKALKRSPLHAYNGMWGTIEHVGSFSYTVQVSITKYSSSLKGVRNTGSIGL